MADKFNEFWLFRNRKNTKRMYQFLHSPSEVEKATSSNITKFLITLGGRIQARKSSSIDVEDVFGFPSISESMAGSDDSIRALIRKRLNEIKEGKVDVDDDDRRGSITSSKSEESEEQREPSPDEINLRYYNIPLRKQSKTDDYEDYDPYKQRDSLKTMAHDRARRRKDSGGSSISRSDIIIDRRDSSQPWIERRDSGHPWMERRGSSQLWMKRGSSQSWDSEDLEMVRRETIYDRGGSPSERGSVSPRSGSLSPERRRSSPKRRLSTRTSWESRKSSLLKDMPWLDVYGPIDLQDDNPTYPIRFLDSNDHAIFRPIKQKKMVKNKLVEEDTVFLKEHKFKTKIEMLKHDRYDHIFYGTIDSEEEGDESCGSDRISFLAEPKPQTPSSDEEYHEKNKDYEKYKPVHLERSLYGEEKLFERVLEIQKVENRKLLYGEKEKPPYCKYDSRNAIEKEKKKIRERAHIDRQEIPVTLRQMHDKEYKYVPVVTCEKGRDHAKVDEEELFRLMELKFGKKDDDGRKRRRGKEPKAMRKTIKKLKRVFRQEFGKKPRKSAKKKAKEIQTKEKIKNLTNKFSDQLYRRVFNRNFDLLLAEAAKNREEGVLETSPRRSTLVSIRTDEKPEPPKVKPRLIARRDFTEVPPKIIKALDNNGILYEENLYDKIDHPLYKTVRVVKKPPVPKIVPVPIIKPPKKRKTKGRKLAPKHKEAPPAPIRKAGGVRQHKDSLKKAKKTKKAAKKPVKGISMDVPIKEEIALKKEETPEPEIRVRTTIIESESDLDVELDEGSLSPRASPPAQPKKHSLKSPDRSSPDGVRKSPEKRVSIDPHPHSPSEDKMHPRERMRSIFSYSGPPRSSKVDKTLIQEVRSRHSLKRKSSSRSPKRRRITIEFDPEAIGTVTESMRRFANYYNVPVSQLSKLAEGKIVIEPEEKKSRTQQKRRKSSSPRQKIEEEETANEERSPSPNSGGEPSLSPRRTIS